MKNYTTSEPFHKLPALGCCSPYLDPSQFAEPRKREGCLVYTFLVDTYATEREKVLSVWSMFHDDDLRERPNANDVRGRSVREQMIHQCVSEDLWFRTMMDIDVNAPPLPNEESRVEFIKRYAEDSGNRLLTCKVRSRTGGRPMLDSLRSNGHVPGFLFVGCSTRHIIADNSPPTCGCLDATCTAPMVQLPIRVG